jgi:mRNA-degrading endonuclease YafQ of YafQ-DinJ toxin-antitoxin module
MPKLVSTQSYERQLAVFIKRHPGLRESYTRTIRLLELNPHHPSLRLHKLKGKLQEYSSVSINMKYRIMLDFIIRDDLIILIAIGSHEQLKM